MEDEILENIKEIIGIQIFDNTKILINTDDKFADIVTSKSVVILLTCVIKGGDEFYPQLFPNHALYDD